MDAQRALLDELMGRNRDGDKPEEDITDFRHSRVCKRYLCGLCPHDLFQNTKMDLGECASLHLPQMRVQFERERLAQPDRDFGYDQELERDLVKFISEVEKKIQRAQRRLEEQDGVKAPSLMDFENCKEVLEITAEIQEVMLKAEEAGNEGEVDLSMELMEKVEELKQKKATAQANAMLVSFRSETAGGSAGADEENPSVSSTDGDSENSGAKENESIGKSLPDVLSGNPLASANVNQKLRVCDVCGAFLSIFDSDRRLADHFGGKLHLGYLQIRKKIKEISEVRRERRRKRNGVSDELDSPKDGKNEKEKKEEPVERRRDRHSRSKSRSKPRRDDKSHRSSGRRTCDRSRDRSRDRHDRDRGSSRRSRRRSRSRSPSRSKSRSPSRSRRRRR
ncbi:Rna-binding protein luc7-like 2-like isoform x1 [Globisporangium polare]